ncbi:MAG: hypothetical protein Q8S73_25570, partial [Deltaproteobacteria bacterium]|nr:hypothetical protein [Deltaproteobacteria bacterium]
GGAERGARGSRGGGAGGGGGRGARPEGTERGGIYVLQGERAVRVPVAVGLTDGVLTEVTAPTLVEGARVVVDETDTAGAAPAPAAAGPGGRAPRTPRVF